MTQLLLYIALAFAVTVALARLLQGPATHFGLVDRPGGRKQHAGDVPIIGGVAMFCGFAVALLAANHPGLPARSVVATLGLLVLVGIIDDHHDLRARYKFVAQIAAALFMILWSGRQISLLGPLFGPAELGLSVFAIPFTIVCVMGVINAVNMMDGIDGLAGSICAVALAWLAIAAALSGLDAQLWMALMALGAIAGFLIFNLRFPWRPKAAIFMGDAGSMMLGFFLVWLTVDLTQGPDRSMPPITAVWIIALPLMDLARVMMTRLRRRQSPLVADRTHLHHLLLARGLGTGQIVAIMVGLSLTGGAIGIGAWQLGMPDWLMFYAFIAVLIAYYKTIRKNEKRAARQI